MIEDDDFYVERPEVMIENGIATISIQGLLTDGMPKIYEKMGLVTSYANIKSAFALHFKAGNSNRINGDVLRLLSGLHDCLRNKLHRGHRNRASREHRRDHVVV